MLRPVLVHVLMLVHDPGKGTRSAANDRTGRPR